MATDRGWANTVLYELERGREFGLVSRVVLQNYELIRLALIEYAEGGAEMPNKDSEPVRASQPGYVRLLV
jgi:hypothetical protein